MSSEQLSSSVTHVVVSSELKRPPGAPDSTTAVSAWNHLSAKAVAVLCDERRRGTHSPGTDGQDSHGHDRPSNRGCRGSHDCPEALLAIPDNASSTTRLPRSAVMSAWSKGGDTSTTSMPKSGTR